jgi:hypothetical protein
VCTLRDPCRAVIKQLTCLSSTPAGDALFGLKAGWSNWESFAEENLLVGWNLTLDVCSWTGVYCFNSSGVGRVYWLCASPANSPPL